MLSVLGRSPKGKVLMSYEVAQLCNFDGDDVYNFGKKPALLALIDV